LRNVYFIEQLKHTFPFDLAHAKFYNVQ